MYCTLAIIWISHEQQVSRASNELKLDLQRTPTPEELAEATGFTVDQVNTCLKQRSFSMTSLDSGGFGKAGSQNGAGPGSSSSGNLVDVTESNTELGKGTVSGDGGEMEAEEHLQRALRVDLGSALSRLLDSEERQCLVLRYGLEDGVPKTIEETARVMNIKNYDVRVFSRVFFIPSQRNGQPTTLATDSEARSARARPDSLRCECPNPGEMVPHTPVNVLGECLTWFSCPSPRVVFASLTIH